MQILCKASDHACDVRCSVCGQGFLIYWTRSSAEDRTAAAEVGEMLCAQHRDSSAHPSLEFSLSVAPKPGYMETLGAYA
ncbi:MAG TPA: hypothetical protein VLI45_08315 [Acidobacteriaceae bacterium]|nr:hypothetical protein [Acidobacteriaceae bacterium]